MRCEFQKTMRLRGVKSEIFHRSGCDYIQEWMRLISENTEEDANGFEEDAGVHGNYPRTGNAFMGYRPLL
jgi:hypothetical protein